MAMSLLKLRDQGSEIEAVVHLDTTQMVDGKPDPLYLVRHIYPPGGEGLSGNQYRLWLRDDLRSRCQRQLQELQRALIRMDNDAGTPLAGEGGAL